MRAVGRGLSLRRLSAAAGDSTVPTGLSYWHQPGPDPLTPLTVGQLVERAARRWPHRDALVSVAQGRRLTFADALRQADAAAGGLLAAGLRPGDRLAIWGPNTEEWAVAAMAAARAGLVLVTLNPAYRADELRYCLRAVAARGLVVSSRSLGQYQDYHSLLLEAAPELASAPAAASAPALPDLRAVVFADDEPLPGAMRWTDVLSAGARRGPDLAELQQMVQSDDPATVQFTSGTTGQPKAAVLSHHNIVNNSFLVGKRFGFHRQEGGERICLQVPLFHCYGFCNGLLAALHHGATLVMPGPRFQAPQALAALRSERCTSVYGTPTMYVDLVAAAEAEPSADKQQHQQQGLPTLRMALSSGSPGSPELFKRMRAALGLKRVCSVYGMTETSPVVFQSLPTDSEYHMTHTVGHVSDHVEARVTDRDGRAVPLGQPGELWVRGYCCARGYWGDEARSRELLRPDGWLRTGDQFVLLPDGYGQVVGRLKDVVIRGGENIYPAEVEVFLETHPAVAEAQAFGVPDPRLGEVLCACIRLRGGRRDHAPSEDDIKAFCKDKIAYYKIPHIVRVVQEFPKTASGKIQKFRLREDLMRERQARADG